MDAPAKSQVRPYDPRKSLLYQRQRQAIFAPVQVGTLRWHGWVTYEISRGEWVNAFIYDVPPQGLLHPPAILGKAVDEAVEFQCPATGRTGFALNRATDLGPAARLA